MTTRLVALWTPPEDVDGFDADYLAAPMMLVAPMPGLTGLVDSKVIDGPYFRMTDLLHKVFGNRLDALIDRAAVVRTGSLEAPVAPQPVAPPSHLGSGPIGYGAPGAPRSGWRSSAMRILGG